MEGNIRETNINLPAIENVSGKNRMVFDTDRLKKINFQNMDNGGHFWVA